MMTRKGAASKPAAKAKGRTDFCESGYQERKARSFRTWGSSAGSDITHVMCITVHRPARVQSPGNRDGHPDRWTLPGDFTTRTVLVALARPPYTTAPEGGDVCNKPHKELAAGTAPSMVCGGYYPEGGTG